MTRRHSGYRVWLVDDREENRKKFSDKVMEALKSGEPPDALVSDVYFYADEVRREEVERLVEEKAQELKRLAQQFKAEDAQLGIRLIRDVRDFFGGAPRFPIYTYTSKGPYLLEDNAFNELEELGAEWLFKNKYQDYTERGRIAKGVEECRKRFDWRYRIRKTVILTGLGSAVLGAVLGVFLDRLARHWGL
jgi:hypothetical protein